MRRILGRRHLERGHPLAGSSAKLHPPSVLLNAKADFEFIAPKNVANLLILCASASVSGADLGKGLKHWQLPSTESNKALAEEGKNANLAA